MIGRGGLYRESEWGTNWLEALNMDFTEVNVDIRGDILLQTRFWCLRHGRCPGSPGCMEGGLSGNAHRVCDDNRSLNMRRPYLRH